jgi:hypothetical protein
MIPIPLTKYSVNWQFLLALVFCMAIAQTWWRGLLSFLVGFFALWLFTALASPAIDWLLYAKHRRPDETMKELSARMSTHYAANAAARGKLGDSIWTSNYRYLTLACGHTVYQFFPNDVPEEGEIFWCWGHHRHGPAQPETIISISQFYPTDVDSKIILV